MFNSHQWIEGILKKLYEAEHRRLQINVNKVVEANNTLYKVLADGFFYNGEFYGTPVRMKGKRVSVPLHIDLFGQMDDHIHDANTLAEDGVKIRQLLFKLLEPCGNTGHMAQDIRDAVPDCIQDALPNEIRCLGRIRPNEQMVPLPDMGFYREIMPKIEFYAAARMFY